MRRGLARWVSTDYLDNWYCAIGEKLLNDAFLARDVDETTSVKELLGSKNTKARFQKYEESYREDKLSELPQFKAKVNSKMYW